MAETFELSVVTPQGEALKESVASVTLPSAMGEIGILPNHCEFVGLLGTGILEYSKASGENRKIVVSEGLIQFSNNKLSITADTTDLPGKGLPAISLKRPELEKIVTEGNTLNPEFDRAKKVIARLDAIQSLN